VEDGDDYDGDEEDVGGYSITSEFLGGEIINVWVWFQGIGNDRWISWKKKKNQFLERFALADECRLSHLLELDTLVMKP